ncbi:hypothetical protein niasHT_029416 [Heterodera trifolii]|uniref:Ankyrin repeat domain-containing protein n=1 Tax=Heterodera trifolii TaxID=157864 RepID=A0ABD2KQ08_9BILA
MADTPPTPTPPPAAAASAAGDETVDLERRVRQLVMSIGQGNEQALREMSILIESFNQKRFVDFVEIMARMHVESGTSIDMPGGQHGTTMLMIAAASGRVDFARYLLNHGAIVGRLNNTGSVFALLLAAESGCLAMCRLLVEECAAEVNQQAIDGTTPLIGASSEGRLDVVIYLIDHGADVQHADTEAYNSLMHAVKNGKTEVARHLLTNGASIDQLGNDGKRAQDLAEEGGIAEMMDIFCTTTADERTEAERNAEG